MSTYACVSNRPPGFKNNNKVIFDEGNGIPIMTKDNITVQDVYRNNFLFLSEGPNQIIYKNMANKTLDTLNDGSPLKELFFSQENTDRIQKKIKKDIFIKTNGKFKLTTDQDETDVRQVMKATYLEYAKQNPNYIIRQVKFLNEKTLEFIIPSILENLKQLKIYLRDIDSPLDPIMLPVNASRGGKVLPSITTRW